MFETIIRHFPDELRSLVIFVLEEGSRRELLNHRMEKEPLWVAKQIGLSFEAYKPFVYRGYVFELIRFRDSPSMYDDPSDYRVKMYKPYPKGSERHHGKEFGNIDFDDCHLETLEPFIRNLIDYGIPYEHEYPNDWITKAYKMIENQDMEEVLELLQTIKNESQDDE